MIYRRMLALAAVVSLIVAGGWLKDAPQSTAVSMSDAAQAFLGGLSGDAKAQAMMSFDDPARTDWHYIPKDKRKGLQIKEMNAAQRQLALGLLKTGLSSIGYDKATTIMSLESILRELEKTRKDGPIRDPERYYFTVFGSPSKTDRWGWSVEGHHLSLNFACDDGRVTTVTPSFFGSNPGINHYSVEGAPAKGVRVQVKEEQLAFDLLGSLKEDQKKTAIVADKAPADVAGAGQAQAKVADPVGLAAGKMTDEQKKTLWEIIETYVRNMPGELAEPRLAEIKDAGVDKIYFAWMGADKPGVGHFYRIQGPTFLIELVNVQPDGNGLPANHIHALYRSLKGDFGLKP